MYLIACGALLAAGLVLNIGDRRMLFLTMLVGASVFVPVPHESAEHFYSFCIAIEVAVGLTAWRSGTSAGAWVTDLCVLLVIAHVMGYALDGNLPFSPYRLVVKILELSQLAVCAALSPIMAPILRNQDATTT
jgi:hypothetical protein